MVFSNAYIFINMTVKKINIINKIGTITVTIKNNYQIIRIKFSIKYIKKIRRTF